MDPATGTTIGLVIMTWGLAGGAMPPQAAAERSYSLEYRAAAGCPDAAVLTQAIETRTPGAVQQSSERAAVRLRVELRDDGTSALQIDLPEGGSRREFPRAACADAVASIAVIASMVLEADDSERAATTQSVMERFEPAAAPPAAAPPPAAVNAPTAPPVPAALPPPAPAPKPTRARFNLSAGALLESAVASGAALGGSAGVAAWLEPHGNRFWLPRIQAELLATLPASVHAADGDVELRLLAGRLHVCPLRLPLTRTLRLVPCLTGDAGTLNARGSGDTLNPRTRTMPWLALGGTLRAELALGPVVSLESWLGLRGLTRADSFVFSPSFPAYQVPQWSLGAGLGLAITLP